MKKNLSELELSEYIENLDGAVDDVELICAEQNLYLRADGRKFVIENKGNDELEWIQNAR